MLRTLVRPNFLTSTLLAATIGVLILGAGDAIAGKKKKKKGKDDGPKVGWHKQDGWSGDCYYPPDFSVLASGPKRVAWNEARESVMGQWRGQRGDGIKLDDRHVENLETAVLGKPERTEAVVNENLEKCEAYMKGKITAAQWESWIVEIAGRLTEGECPHPPIDYTLLRLPERSASSGRSRCQGVQGRPDLLGQGVRGMDFYKIDRRAVPWINGRR